MRGESPERRRLFSFLIAAVALTGRNCFLRRLPAIAY
jgi:hypothetical protein